MQQIQSNWIIFYKLLKTMTCQTSTLLETRKVRSGPLHAEKVPWASLIPAKTQFSHSVVSDSFRPHGLQHTRLSCLSPTPGACSNCYPSSQWCHPTILSSLIPFSSCLLSCPASGSFQWISSLHQVTKASASVLPVNIQDWFPLGWTGLIFLQSKGLSRVFSNTTVQKHQF